MCCYACYEPPGGCGKVIGAGRVYGECGRQVKKLYHCLVGYFAFHNLGPAILDCSQSAFASFEPSVRGKAKADAMCSAGKLSIRTSEGVDMLSYIVMAYLAVVHISNRGSI